jgi:hypothetical protein
MTCNQWLTRDFLCNLPSKFNIKMPGDRICFFKKSWL